MAAVRHSPRMAAAAAAQQMVRRAAFDIGSGMSKMMVSDVDRVTGRIIATHFAEEREVLFAADWKASGERSELSDGIQARGLEVLGALREIASDLGATELRGVATEVFRKASNGSEYLETVAEQLGIRASVIAQTEEARLGWLTAVAALEPGEDAAGIVAWDSGGGSFQVSARLGGEEVVCFNGAWGSTVATEALMTRVQEVTYTGGGSSPNPVSADHAQQLVEIIRATMEPPPTWLAERVESGKLVGIGGNTCIFRLAAEVSGALPPQAGGLATVALSREAVRGAIESSVEKSDEELGAVYLQPQMVVPKLCLTLAVMQQLGITDLTYQPACGSCAGLLIHDFYWGGGGPMAAQGDAYWPTDGGGDPAALPLRQPM